MSKQARQHAYVVWRSERRVGIMSPRLMIDKKGRAPLERALLRHDAQ